MGNWNLELVKTYWIPQSYTLGERVVFKKKSWHRDAHDAKAQTRYALVSVWKREKRRKKNILIIHNHRLSLMWFSGANSLYGP